MAARLPDAGAPVRRGLCLWTKAQPNASDHSPGRSRPTRSGTPEAAPKCKVASPTKLTLLDLAARRRGAIHGRAGNCEYFGEVGDRVVAGAVHADQLARARADAAARWAAVRLAE